MAKYEITSGISFPIGERARRLALAQTIYDQQGIGKSTAAKLAIAELGIWRTAVYQSAVDYLRRHIIAR